MSTTTSIRLPPELRERVEHAEKTLHHGKNWIINRALDEYLKKLERHTLKKEADRQCHLLNEADKIDDTDIWLEQMQDTEGWV